MSAPAGANFYVSTTGNDSNSGKSAASPMASLAALMNAYTLQPGDIIHVGAGTYALPTSVVLTAADSGAREILSRLSAGAATIFSGDVAATSPIFEFDGGHDITLENMTLRGGTIGVDVVDNSGSVDVTLQGLEISGFVGAAGVYEERVVRGSP